MSLLKIVPEPLESLVHFMNESHQNTNTLTKQLESLSSHIHSILHSSEYTPPTASAIQATSGELLSLSTQIGQRYSEGGEELQRFLLMAKLADHFPFGLLSMLPTALLQRLAVFVGSGETKLSSEQELMKEMFHYVTPEEYAKLSAAIYDNEDKLETTLKELGINDKFKPVPIDDKLVNHYWNGMDAGLFQVIGTNQYIVTFRGTEGDRVFQGGWKDIGEDVAGVFGVPILGVLGAAGPRIPASSQYKSAEDFVEKVQKKVGKNGKITTTGHSLGGWLATTMASKYNIAAVTFNAPRFSKETKSMYLQNDNKKMVHFRTDDDPVSENHTILRMKYSPGLNIPAPNAEHSSFPHGILNHFRFDKDGSILVSSGQGDLPMTKSIDNEIVTKEHLDDLTGSVLEYENARRWSYDWNSMHRDQKSDAGRTALLNEIDKTIAEYKELGEYQSIGERNVPDEVNAGEIDDREDKIRKLNAPQFDQSPKEREERIAKLNDEIRDLKTGYHSNDEKVIERLEWLKKIVINVK